MNILSLDIISKAKFSAKKIKEKGLTLKECLFGNYDDQKTQFKILKE